jgi:hypothetical protein
VRHWWFWLDPRAAYEHQFHVADEASGREAPTAVHTVVRHAPLHRTLETRQRLGRQGIDVFGDLALRLRQVAMYANTGSSPSAAFAALALPVMCGKQRRGLVALGVDDAFAAAAADFLGPCVHL